MSNTGNVKYKAWLFLATGMISLIISWKLYYNCFFCFSTWQDLFKALVPNLLSPIIIFLILYLLFFRKGVDFEKVLRGETPRWFKTAYESYDDIKWSTYFTKSRKLIIVAFFFEEWIIQNKKKISQFLKRENSTLIVYLPDYTELNLLNRLNDLIPEHHQQELSIKIKSSIKALKEIVGDNTQNVHVLLYDKPFNYTYQMFDKLMFLSFNELSRKGNYKSPFIVFDLQHSKTLEDFFNSETNALEAASKPINLTKWTNS